jgi:hypothetical protein
MKTRLIIEFRSPEALADWVEQEQQLEDLEYHHGVRIKFAAYRVDGLDDVRADNNTYILKREGSRPEEFRLRIVTTETTERVV